ncbi:MAG: MBL fold metallo-hydrolase [Oscillospiraceae bacterium]|nr:MBL fold metallo-hydrolase [Oscillospiraceae bacterium]
MVEITCIGHSGFLVELPGHNLIFDYFTDKKRIITPEIFKNKKTCVFVSHRHFDHYNKDIFRWNGWGDIVYVLDSGCSAPKSDNIIFVSVGGGIDVFDDVNVKTYGSTDEGVSFLVKTGGFTIFHAGDLNDWYWEGESTPEELVLYENNYINIIKQLAGIKIDAAFVPEDPRLGRNSGRGVRLFKEIVAPAKIIPMHFSGNDGVRC